MQPLRRRRLIGLLVLAGLWLASADRLHAQITSTVPSFMMPQPEVAAPGANFNSAVSWIDSVYPQSQVRIRGDFLYDSVQPQRAEYIWAQGGLPGTPGPSLRETKLDTQEVETYVEFAFGGVFSIFLETPYVFMNPSVNPSTNGIGDTNAGFKWMFLPGQDLQLSLQLRAYFPTGLQAELGTHHYTLEPALLGHYNLLGLLQIEGELRFWAPIGGTEFAGDIVRYGLGLSYGQRSASDIWLMPVVEVIGWTVLSGETYAEIGPNPFAAQSAAGATIVNAYAGLRLGLGSQFDFYAGYGRGLTGDQWYRDNFRLEFRFLF